MPNPLVPIYGKTTTGANEAIGCTTPTAATGTLTFSGQPANGETFTIGGRTYTFVTALTTTGNQVFIGVDTATSIGNAVAAINHATGDGTKYSYNTPANTLATAAVGSSTTLVATATNFGADGNGLATTDTIANASWGATTLTGGVSASLLTAGAGSGGAIIVTPRSVTPNFFAVTASSTTVIPIGAINSSVVILTGTGTLNAVDQPVGIPWTEPNTLGSTVTLVLGSPGTARVYYGT